MKSLITCLLLLLCCFTLNAQVKIGNNVSTVHPNSILELESSSKGLLIPRLTSIQRINITAPQGLMVYDSTLHQLMVLTDTGWASSNGGNFWKATGANITNSNSGNVGIGTSTPLSPLTVAVNATSGIVNDDIRMESYGTSTGEPAMVLSRARGTIALPQNLANGDNLGRLVLEGRVNNMVGGTNANILGIYRGNGTTNSTVLAFSTSGSEKMRLDENGYLGIGTAAPLSPLSISVNGTTGQTEDDIRLEAYESTTTGGPGLVLSRGRGTIASPANVNAGDLLGGIVLEGRTAGTTGGTNATILGYYRGNGTTNLTELRMATSGSTRMTIDQSGNVGINTTTPASSAKLDVSSTTQGFLPPRMTTAQRNAIASPVDGLTIYNTTSSCINYYQNGGWYDPCAALAAVTGKQKLESLFGGTGDDWPRSMQQTSDGGFVLTGWSSSSASGDVSGTNGGGTNDGWVLKLDASGNVQWNKLIGGSGDDGTYSVRQTSDGGYIVAGYSNSSVSGNITATGQGGYDFLVVKLDAAGNIIWNKLLGGSGNDFAYNIRQTLDGGYIVAGGSASSASGDVSGTGHGMDDYWIVKLTSTGTISWQQLLGGSGSEYVRCIEQTKDSGFVAVGFSTSSASGDVSGTNHGSFDYWVVKLNASGSLVWNSLLGGSGGDEPHVINQTSDGGYIVAGGSGSSASGDVTATSHGGVYDYWIVKLNTTGGIVWQKLLGGSGDDFAQALQQTSDGGYIIAGKSTSSAAGDVSWTNHGLTDSWLVKLDASGNAIWNQLLGGSGDEQAFSVYQTSDGGYVMASYATSSVSGDVTGTNHGGKDYWVTKLNTLGQILR